MRKLTVAIIDDEPDSIKILQLLLAEHCPQVTVVGTYTSAMEASKEVASLNPDLLLLDVEMPEMNGFELLETLSPLSFHVIFVTAYQEFAIKAFRSNALDFIVKPVDVKELKEAVQSAFEKAYPERDQLEQLRTQLHTGVITKISVPTQSGVVFIMLNDILYTHAEGNYVSLQLQDGRTLLISRSLKEIQDVLEEFHFLRIHRQYIINLNQVKSYNRNEGILTMEDDAKLPVSRSLKDVLISKYGSF